MHVARPRGWARALGNVGVSTACTMGLYSLLLWTPNLFLFVLHCRTCLLFPLSDSRTYLVGPSASCAPDTGWEREWKFCSPTSTGWQATARSASPLPRLLRTRLWPGSHAATWSAALEPPKGNYVRVEVSGSCEPTRAVSAEVQIPKREIA